MLSNLEDTENRFASSPTNDAPLVDVVLITYNHERFVSRAIEGVLSQETSFPVHLIIGDDCSSDNTQDIIRKHAAECRQPVTLLLDQEHRGLKHPERVGIRALTTGRAKYIALLDGDDYWTSPRKLQKQVEFLESHPDFSVCFHNALMFFEDGSQPSRNLRGADQKPVSTLEDLLETNFIPTSTTLIRRSALPTMPNWLFDLSVADWPLYVLFAERGQIGYLSEVMANYRVHQKGAWSSGTKLNRAAEVITMFDHLDRHFDYRYQRKIRLAKAEWYYELSETTCSSGDLPSSQMYFRNYIDCEGSVLQRRIASLVMRAYLPRLYRLLRAIRNRMRPVSQGLEVTKRLATSSPTLTLSQRERGSSPNMKTVSIDSSINAAPLVDVNLVTYNHEKYVAQSIESVLAQKTNFRFRLIVGDDCSTDQTQAIVLSYAQKYPDRIILFLDDQHRGLRNRDRAGQKVLSLSTAKYVAWLDGDDFWTDPKKLQKQVDVLESDPGIAICFHNVSTFHQQGDAPSENLRPPEQKEVSTLEDLLKGNFIPSCSVMFRRDAIGELPEWYYTLKMGDWPLYILTARKGRIRYINEVMAAYRVHGGGSWSPRQRTHHDVNFLQMLDHVDRHFDFKFKNQIDATKSRYYFELAESYYERGHPKQALVPIKRGLRSSRFRHRGLLSFYLQVKAPHIYNSLRTLRNLLRPQRSDNPGVVR